MSDGTYVTVNSFAHNDFNYSRPSLGAPFHFVDLACVETTIILIVSLRHDYDDKNSKDSCQRIQWKPAVS